MAREREPGGLDLLILSLLSEREMYGYEIVTELARRSDETFLLREGPDEEGWGKARRARGRVGALLLGGQRRPQPRGRVGAKKENRSPGEQFWWQ